MHNGEPKCIAQENIFIIHKAVSRHKPNKEGATDLAMGLSCQSQLIIHFDVDFIHCPLFCISNPELVEVSGMLLNLTNWVIFSSKQSRCGDSWWLSLRDRNILTVRTPGMIANCRCGN